MSRILCRRILTGLFTLTAGLLLVACTPEEKHRVLVFLFDGVPPLHPEEEPGPPTKGGISEVEKVKRPKRPQVVWYVHEPVQDRNKCSSCHDLRSAFRLLKPKAELCLSCHIETTREYPRMHGPVAVGDCAACHEAHRSQFRHVLKQPAPALCFQCHEPTPSVGRTLGCARESDSAACTDCHSGHGGKAAYYLLDRTSKPTPPAAPRSPDGPSGEPEKPEPPPPPSPEGL